MLNQVTKAAVVEQGDALEGLRVFQIVPVVVEVTAELRGFSWTDTQDFAMANAGLFFVSSSSRTKVDNMCMANSVWDGGWQRRVVLQLAERTVREHEVSVREAGAV